MVFHIFESVEIYKKNYYKINFNQKIQDKIKNKFFYCII